MVRAPGSPRHQQGNQSPDVVDARSGAPVSLRQGCRGGNAALAPSPAPTLPSGSPNVTPAPAEKVTPRPGLPSSHSFPSRSGLRRRWTSASSSASPPSALGRDLRHLVRRGSSPGGRWAQAASVVFRGRLLRQSMRWARRCPACCEPLQGTHTGCLINTLLRDSGGHALADPAPGLRLGLNLSNEAFIVIVRRGSAGTPRYHLQLFAAWGGQSGIPPDTTLQLLRTIESHRVVVVKVAGRRHPVRRRRLLPRR